MTDQDTTSTILALLSTIDGKVDGLGRKLDHTNGRLRDAEEEIARLDATCVERGKSCGRGGVIVSWRVASVIAVAVLVLGALLGPETVKTAVGLLK